MEKKNMDKIDQIYDIVEKRMNDINSKFDALLKEFLTPEMVSMIEVIRDTTRSNYQYRFDTNKKIVIGKCPLTNWAFGCYMNGDNGNKVFKINRICHTGYDDYAIRCLEEKTDEINEVEEYYKLITINIKDIINNITEQYRVISETQSNKLNKILSNLGTDYTPTKHIKVTVEWVEEE